LKDKKENKEFIVFKDCTKVYPNGVTGITDANLIINKGDFVFVIGQTASGKSTLIKLLYREEKPTSGSVMIGGINVGKLRNARVYKLRRKIGIVFQDFKLLPKLTAYENVAYPLYSYGMKESQIRPMVLEAMEQVGLKDKTRSFPNQLSGGEQQRVCIARAIVNKPKLIICDEPTGNLDPDTSKEIMDLINKINKDGTTVVMATHDKDIVNRMKKRVVVVKDAMIDSDNLKGSYKFNEST
jgi:cell division transport system ATP-binding protein